MVRSNETQARSLAKTISYRLYQSFLVSPLIVYFLSGDLWLSFKFGITEFIVKIPAYYSFYFLLLFIIYFLHGTYSQVGECHVLYGWWL
ncbi:MAG: DUF2061 domain-containing protein [Candidatus Asgardarchaeia archaeon]